MNGDDIEDAGATIASDAPIFILTSHFPYMPGEQFLETEIAFWNRDSMGPVVVVPRKANGAKRETPPGITISDDVSRQYDSLARRLSSGLRALVSSLFWRELKQLRDLNRLTVENSWSAFTATVHTIIISAGLRITSQRLGAPRLVYSYWFSYETIAAARTFASVPVVTRAHRGDLYEEAHSRRHLFLRRQVVKDITAFYPISEHGREYLSRVYNRKDGNVLSRLGILINRKTTHPSQPTELHVLSVSYIIQIKRLDRIIDALAPVALKRPDLTIKWDHIGDGPLREGIEKYAQEKLTGANISWVFHGAMDNSAVLSFMDNNKIDVFLNASESEGVPVTIMEAMSRGIPAVAPDVGGVSDIVTEETGILLSSDAGAAEIAQKLEQYMERFKSDYLRFSVKNFASKHYNASVNYTGFIDSLLALTEKT